MSEGHALSVMIPVRNPDLPIFERTLRSLLAQTHPWRQAQVMVLDNASTTGVEELVRTLGEGRVGYLHHGEDLGMVGNWNACLRLATGDLVHILHADDTIHPRFHEKCLEAFAQAPAAGVVFADALRIDGQDRPLFSQRLNLPPGVLDREVWLRLIASRCHVAAPTVVVRKAAYDAWGGYDQTVGSAADWEMWIRLARHVPFYYLGEELGCYRYHQHNSSWSFARQGRELESAARVIRRARETIPREILPDALYAETLEFHANWALRQARMWLLCYRACDVAFALMRQALQFSASPRVLSDLASVVGEFDPEGEKLALEINEALFPNVELLLQRAWAWHGRGESRQALALSRYLLPFAARRAEAWILLGALLGDRGEPTPARAALERALTLHPGHPDALRRLALLPAAEVPGAGG